MPGQAGAVKGSGDIRAEIVLISMRLSLEGDALTGYWASPEGDSDVIELARRK